MWLQESVEVTGWCVSTAEDHGVETVPNALCNQAEVPEAEQKCSLYCPSECAVSDWGQWSPCPQVCDPSIMQTRTRQVLRSPASSKPCPEDSQMKPCILNQNCFQYQYNLTGWSGCQLGANATCGHGERRRLLSCQRSDGATVSMQLCQQGGQCGDGLQVRNLTCVVHDASVSATSRPVENALCGELPSKESVLQLPCSVPCPGDCHLTEWSEWSSCELTCISGRSFETSGRQSRSRAFLIQSAENRESCSGQEMETRPCSGGKCYDYLWQTSPWRDNVRTVWCQRSDGMNVTDGKLKVWVYGVSAGGFFIIVFLIFTSYLMCKKTKQHQSPPPQQKPLTLAYDGDIDM
ncbi:hypothetical protein TURU_163621 [Turdus rufiventris]|nr:hypothetical protein TURU_163621 [Turdus rufiventris]